MRLTIFSGAWYPQEGGAEKQLRQVSERLATLGWRVTVVTRGCDFDSRSMRATMPTVVKPVCARGWMSSTKALGDSVVFSRTVSQGLRTRPDVVLASLIGSASVAAATVATLARCPLVWRIGGDVASHMSASRIRRVGVEGLAHRSDVIAANAPHLLQQLRDLTGGVRAGLAVIRNGVDVAEQPDSRTHSGPLRVLFYTNGTAAKNDRGFIELVQSCPEVQFRAVGRTKRLPDLPNLERRGWVEPVDPQFGWADVVLNVSSFEGSPNFCLQALATRRPVVGYANPGLVDLSRTWPNDVHTVPYGAAARIAALLRGRDWRSRAVEAEVATIAEASSKWDQLLRGLAQQ